MRKAQMFIVTAVFLTSMLFAMQQALVTYASLDSTTPFRAREFYILKGITDSVDATIKSDATNCAGFQKNVEELLSAVRDDVSAEGYIFSYNFELNCGKWNNDPSSEDPPFRLSVRLSETYDATGMIDFYHEG